MLIPSTSVEGYLLSSTQSLRTGKIHAGDGDGVQKPPSKRQYFLFFNSPILSSSCPFLLFSFPFLLPSSPVSLSSLSYLILIWWRGPGNI